MVPDWGTHWKNTSFSIELSRHRSLQHWRTELHVDLKGKNCWREPPVITLGTFGDMQQMYDMIWYELIWFDMIWLCRILMLKLVIWVRHAPLETFTIGVMNSFLGEEKFHSVKCIGTYWQHCPMQLIQKAEGKAKSHPQVFYEEVDSALRIWERITRSSTEEGLLSLIPVWRVMATSAGSCWSTSPAQRIHPTSLRQQCVSNTSTSSKCLFQFPSGGFGHRIITQLWVALMWDPSKSSCIVSFRKVNVIFWEKAFVIDLSGPDRPWSWYFHSEVISRSRKLSVVPNLRRASQPSSWFLTVLTSILQNMYIDGVYTYREILS